MLCSPLICRMTPLINHYPDKVSDKIDVLSVELSNKEKIRADDNIRSMAKALQKDVLIFYGTRPSLLTPSTIWQRSNYLTKLCRHIDIVCVEANIFVKLLWWPHHSGTRYHSSFVNDYFEDIMRLLNLLVRAVTWKIATKFPDTFGFNYDQATAIKSWFDSLPLIAQLDTLLPKLSLGWNTPDKITRGPPTFALDIQSRPSIPKLVRYLTMMMVMTTTQML
jgi:hypothetical protein